MNKYIKHSRNSFADRNGFFCGALAYFAMSVIIYISSRASEVFADFFSKYLGGAIRLVLAGITSIFPFSLAEAILIIIIPVSVAVIFLVPDKAEGKFMSRNSYVMLGVLLLLASIFLSAFAPCYFRTTLEKELELDRENVSIDDICYAVNSVSSEIATLEEKITYDHTGKTLMPYSYSELVEKLNNAYDSLTEKYDFLSDFYSYPKPLAVSKVMPYTRISGFYTFFTGEANISTAYPDYILPYTMAHEMAHQRGIAREDEANFIAFLVCIESNDYYIRYSGYAEILNYLLDAVYSADSELYWTIYDEVPDVYRGEYSAYVQFINDTSMDKVSGVTDIINDTMLQSQGQTAGSESYNLVTELAASYYKWKRSEND